MGMLIKFYRERAGLLQRELSLEVGVSETTLSLWETDVRKPSLKNLRKLEATLKVTLCPGWQEVTGDRVQQAAGRNRADPGGQTRLRADVLQEEINSLNSRLRQLRILMGEVEVMPG